ncbi:hypothetical protein BCV70DRAFT_36104 [Testicularia cyperi]|uniref:Uncharacterized protein n=1 Tax=Testicularia cyperi TaxID=1882483 RepID=A0A317XK68_9BASI|nr:hypothetical protein BCV70DRAFT_36104 [Testicularia cyperi]
MQCISRISSVFCCESRACLYCTRVFLVLVCSPAAVSRPGLCGSLLPLNVRICFGFKQPHLAV